jgi:hypothetical protein
MLLHHNTLSVVLLIFVTATHQAAGKINKTLKTKASKERGWS